MIARLPFPQLLRERLFFFAFAFDRLGLHGRVDFGGRFPLFFPPRLSFVPFSLDRLSAAPFEGRDCEEVRDWLRRASLGFSLRLRDLLDLETTDVATFPAGGGSLDWNSPGVRSI